MNIVLLGANGTQQLCPQRFKKLNGWRIASHCREGRRDIESLLSAIWKIPGPADLALIAFGDNILPGAFPHTYYSIDFHRLIQLGSLQEGRGSPSERRTCLPDWGAIPFDCDSYQLSRILFPS